MTDGRFDPHFAEIFAATPMPEARSPAPFTVAEAVLVAGLGFAVLALALSVGMMAAT